MKSVCKTPPPRAKPPPWTEGISGGVRGEEYLTRNGNLEVGEVAAPHARANAHSVTFRDALRVWTKICLLSFGGPAGQIALMHRILVEEKRWIS